MIILDFTVSKFLVVTGKPLQESRRAEIIDVTNPNLNCRIQDFPIELWYSTGGFTKYGPLICSGWDKNHDEISTCYQLTEEGKFQRFQQSLERERIGTASIVTSTGDLWFLGGWMDGGRNMSIPLNYTELISYGADSEVTAKFKTVKPTLPKVLSNHCISKIDSTRAILTGTATYYLNLIDFKIWEGPKMRQGRNQHGCGSFEFNEKRVTIVVGGQGYSHSYLDSTEYLIDTPNSQWQEGNKSENFYYHLQ